MKNCSSDLQPFGAGILRDEQLVGLVLGYITYSRNALLRYFSARAIINGGPLLAVDITDDELTQLLRSIEDQQSPIYIETRNFRDYVPWRETFERVGWNYCPHYDVWADVDNQWKERMHESKVRKVRNTLPDCEIVELVYAPEHEAAFDTWYAKLNELYHTKVHRPLLSRETLLEGWQSGMTLLLVKQKSSAAIFGGVLLPYDEQWAYEYYICGPTIVTYAMLQWCEERGICHLDMMGAGEPDVPYGVRDFKLQMGGNLHEFGRFLYVRSTFRYYMGKWVMKLKK